jgi:hypothetical protein
MLDMVESDRNFMLALCPGEAPAGSTNQERAAATLQLTWGLAEFLFWIQTNTNFDFLLEKNS